MKKSSTFACCSTLLVIFLSGFHLGYGQIQNKNFEIGKNLEIFVDVFKQVNANYVDDIDPGDFMKTGIDELLKTLDPYTNYIPESEIEDYRIATTGQYGGVGALIHSDGEYIVITDPYKNSPAKRAGIKAGDIVLSVNGKSAVGLSSDEISQIMKGAVGVKVDLVIQRHGEEKPLHFSMIREVINIESVDYFEKLSQDIGYIKLDGFTPNSASKVRDAVNTMRNEGKLKGLILDLRDNGGGLLGEAVDIVNLFVKSGLEVVSMRGQIASANQTFRTRNQPLDTDIPVVVLVNEHSASSSEIVGGALQDLDRAVIMGQRTYGKGLVQNILPLIYNTQLKVTIAKYYIPSGRCIQAVDYSHKNALGKWDKVPDSLITKFHTLGGRPVYDGAGIDPDVITTPYTLNDITMALIAQHILFNFATQFYYKNPTVPPLETFDLDNDTWNQFLTYVNEYENKYKTAEQILLTVLEEYYKDDKNTPSPQIATTMETLQKQLKENKITAIKENKNEICRLLKMEILSRYYDYEQYIKFYVEFDDEIKKAKNLLLTEKEYKAILK
jgi:carboxyl-terminal processing protease